MKIDLDRCELIAAPPGDDRFEAVRERRAVVTGGPRVGHDALRHAVVECRTHELVEGKSCGRCSHFLNAVPAADGQSVLVRCVIFETDTVDVLMTRTEDLITVPDDETTSVAAVRMMDHDVQQLLVTDGEKVVGLVEARLIAGSWGRVHKHVSERFPVVPRTMELGAAARAFRAAELDVAGVLEGDELVGVITRGDMRRAGVPGL